MLERRLKGSNACKSLVVGKGVEEEGKEGSKFQESQGVREAAENK